MDLTFGIFCAIVPCVRYLALAAVYSIPSNRSTSPPLLRALDELGVKIPTPRFLPPTRQLATSPFSPFAAPDPCNSFLFTSFADPSNYLLSFHIFPKKHPGVGSTSVPLLPLCPPLLTAHHSSLAAMQKPQQLLPFSPTRVTENGPRNTNHSLLPFSSFRYTILSRHTMTPDRPTFATVEDAVEEIRQGRMIVLVDDEDRENEGDLTMAAEKITPEAINFMAKYGRGLICLTLTEQRCDELHLPLMSPINTSVHGTAFCEAIDARVGVTTGVSASDRAITILTAIDPKTRPQDLARPGHVFPLRARNGGVLVRAGQTEASVDLSRIASLNASGVICEIMNEDGTMARVPQLHEFCKQHNLKMLTVADLIRYRMQHERYVRRVAEATVPTRYGDFRMIAYASDVDHDQHIALVRGTL